ncbi:MAG: metallophosphoesterase [Xenococcus sp. (in: cyanobacteria)]
MAGITWLHLSDWHQRGKEFDRMVVRDALIEDIRHRNAISQDLVQIDFIVFSGDVAHSGKEEEYDTAIQEFFDPVLEATGLKEERNKRLFIVPGNHDLDRSKFELLPLGLQQPFQDHSEVKKWLANQNPAMLSRVLDPFEKYREFVNGYTEQTTPDYANILPLEIEEKKVALLGINSALMAGRNKDKHDKVDDYGKLIVGEPQIYDALNQLEEYDLRIAVLHHPLEWLSEFDRRKVRMLLADKCHFILYGHQHEPGFSQVQGIEGNYLLIPAGASYERRNYPNSYNFVHLDFVNQEGKMYLRRWSSLNSQWIRDDETYHEGEYTFRLPTKKDKLKRVSPADYRKLVHELTQKYRKIDDWKTLHNQWQTISNDLFLAQSDITKRDEKPASYAFESLDNNWVTLSYKINNFLIFNDINPEIIQDIQENEWNQNIEVARNNLESIIEEINSKIPKEFRDIIYRKKHGNEYQEAINNALGKAQKLRENKRKSLKRSLQDLLQVVNSFLTKLDSSLQDAIKNFEETLTNLSRYML